MQGSLNVSVVNMRLLNPKLLNPSLLNSCFTAGELAPSAVDQPELSGIMDLRKFIFPTSVENTAAKEKTSGLMEDVDQPSITILDGPDFKNITIATPAPSKETI